MIDISFEIGGRKVNPNQLDNVLEKGVLQQVAESVKNLSALLDVLNMAQVQQ